MNKSKRRDMKPMRKKSGKMRLESSLRNKESMKPLLLLRLNLINNKSEEDESYNTRIIKCHFDPKFIKDRSFRTCSTSLLVSYP
jgi:hypothetical protein